MGPIGYPEMVFIFVLALLLFGPKKLPELGRTIGKAWTEFNRAKTELKATFDREMRALERETEPVKEITNSYYHDTYNYDYSSSYESGEPYTASPAIEAASYSEITAVEAPALESHTIGASATEGAGLIHTATEHAPLSITGTAPEGTIANGNLHNYHGDPSHAAVETTSAD